MLEYDSKAMKGEDDTSNDQILWKCSFCGKEERSCSQSKVELYARKHLEAVHHAFYGNHGLRKSKAQDEASR